MTVENVNNAVTDFLVSQGRLPPWAEKAEGAEFYDEKVASMASKLEDVVGEARNTFFNELEGRVGDPTATDRALAQAFDEKQVDVSQVVRGEAEDIVEGTRMSVVKTMNSMGVDQQFHTINPDVMDDIKGNVDQFSIQAFKDKKETIRDTIQEGVRGGKGTQAITSELQKEFEKMERYKMRRVARTETGYAHNRTKNVSHRDFNVQYEQWLTSQDAAVRSGNPFDHTMMHGQVTKTGGRFTHPNQGWSLKYPQDRSGALGNIINCRCVVTAFFPQNPEQITSTPWYPS